MAIGSHVVSIGNDGSGTGLIGEGVACERGSFSGGRVSLRSVQVVKDADATAGTLRAVVFSDDGSLIAQGSNLTVTSSQVAGTLLEAPFDEPVGLAEGTTYRIGVYQTAQILRVVSGATQHSHNSSPSGYSWEEFDTNLYYKTGAQGFPTSTIAFELSGGFSFDPQVSITEPVAPTTETDSAQSIARTKRKAIATVTETDTAPAVARQKSRAVATATETDAAVAITATTPGIRVAIATVMETDGAPAITRTDPATFVYRLTFPTYPRTFTPVPIGQTARFVLDQAVSIVRVNGTLRQFRSPSQTQLQAAGTEGVDWFIGGRIYEQIPNDVAIELRLAGFETERVA